MKKAHTQRWAFFHFIGAAGGICRFDVHGRETHCAVRAARLSLNCSHVRKLFPTIFVEPRPRRDPRGTGVLQSRRSEDNGTLVWLAAGGICAFAVHGRHALRRSSSTPFAQLLERPKIVPDYFRRTPDRDVTCAVRKFSNPDGRRRQTKKATQKFGWPFLFAGAAGGIRTPDHLVRRSMVSVKRNFRRNVSS